MEDNTFEEKLTKPTFDDSKPAIEIQLKNKKAQFLFSVLRPSFAAPGVVIVVNVVNVVGVVVVGVFIVGEFKTCAARATQNDAQEVAQLAQKL